MQESMSPDEIMAATALSRVVGETRGVTTAELSRIASRRRLRLVPGTAAEMLQHMALAVSYGEVSCSDFPRRTIIQFAKHPLLREHIGSGGGRGAASALASTTTKAAACAAVGAAIARLIAAGGML
jgi:hypothetical protein